MRKIIKNGAVVEDDWRGAVLDLQSFTERVEAGEQVADVGVILEPDQPPSEIPGELNDIPLIAINFPVFTDGRGFSYARELRDKGYPGEIRAVGNFIRDQLAYLQRCGFNAFDFDENVNRQDLRREDVSGPGGRRQDRRRRPVLYLVGGQPRDHYQADVVNPTPLFRRR